jgi:arginyl-tRNA synthetase
MTILEELTEIFEKVHKKLFSEFSPKVIIVPSKHGQLHDYSYNSVKMIYNKMKKTFKISDITDMILSELDSNELIKSFKVDESYINITIRNKYLENNIYKICEQSKPVYKEEVPKLIGVDFSSPNIAKEMHVGHLRSTIIGDTICKMLTYVGHNVKRINHVGDWGTQFGLLLAYLKDLENFDSEIDINLDSIENLTKLYKDSKKRAETDPEFKKRSRVMVTKLQTGDPWATEKWKQMVQTSKKMFEEIYARLGVKFPDGICGESFYNDKINGVIEEIFQKDLLQDQDLDNKSKQSSFVHVVTGVTGVAKVVFTGLKEAKSINKETKEPFEQPLILKKGDGAFCYDSTDAAAVKYRLKELGLDKVIYVTDVGQSTHFKMIFKLAEMMGWSKPNQLTHTKFGMVMDKEGKRFRTRDGDTVRLVNLLDEAQKRVSVELETRIESESEYKTTTLTIEDIPEISEKLGLSAIKYADLKTNLSTNYKFDYDKMLDFNGDTAIYILYSYARLSSIMRRCFKETSITVESILDENIEINSEQTGTEHELIVFINRFDEFLEKAVTKLEPHILCGYLYNLSELNSQFVNKYRLLHDNKDENNPGMFLDPVYGKSRLLILEASRIVMKTIFNVLGIEPLEKI